jgi:hypothetical protein
MVGWVTQRPLGEILAGLVLVAWGAAISLNVRGAAETFPRRMGIGPFWQETSRAQLRLTFGFFGLIGLLILASGVHGL